MLYETNSKLIKPGQIFVAIKGYHEDGHDYISEAIQNGAIKVVGEQDLNLPVPYEKVDNTLEYLNKVIPEQYSDIVNKLKIIGVTGTNGKTTSCYLIYQMLKKLGKNAAYLGTIGYYNQDNYKEVNNTTPDIVNLYKLLLEAVDNNVEYFVMEVSSHALAYERIKGLKFSAASFTNLTEDHLDFHKTMENYLNTKVQITKYLKDDGVMIINSDDLNSDAFKVFPNYQTYGFNGDYKIIEYDIKPDKTNLTFTYKNETYNVTTNLTCLFNVYNYLNAVAILNNIGFALKDIINITHTIYPPKGRCETYKYNQSYIVIDYAHTPDALLKMLNNYRSLTTQKILTIVGCGGDRDPIKRPLMGTLATSLSDYVIFTNDNPRQEDEKKIINEMLKDVQTNNYEVIYARKKAIEQGISLLNPNDILLILGKGHENYQMIGRTKYHLDDAEIVKNVINY